MWFQISLLIRLLACFSTFSFTVHILVMTGFAQQLEQLQQDKRIEFIVYPQRSYKEVKTPDCITLLDQCVSAGGLHQGQGLQGQPWQTNEVIVSASSVAQCSFFQTLFSANASWKKLQLPQGALHQTISFFYFVNISISLMLLETKFSWLMASCNLLSAH